MSRELQIGRQCLRERGIPPFRLTRRGRPRSSRSPSNHHPVYRQPLSSWAPGSISWIGNDAGTIEGTCAWVLDVHTVKPLDKEAIRRAATETGAIVAAEEHLVDGGLGVRVAQAVGKLHPCPMEFIGLQNTYAESGTPEGLLDKYGLIARDLIAAARKVLTRKR